MSASQRTSLLGILIEYIQEKVTIRGGKEREWGRRAAANIALNHSLDLSISLFYVCMVHSKEKKHTQKLT